MPTQIEELFNSNKFTQIINLHKESEELTKLIADDQLRIAAAYFQNQEYNKTLEILDCIAPFHSNSSDYLNLTALAYRKLGNYNKAYDLLTDAEEKDPSSMHIKSNKANIMLDLGKVDEAKEILEKVLEKNPEFKDAKANLARANLLRQQSISTNNIKTSYNIDLESSLDPLLFAFDEGVVNKDIKRFQPKKQKSVQKKNKTKKSEIDNLLSECDSSNQFIADKIKLTTIANQQNNVEESLELSSLLHAQENEISSVLLANVSDCYIKKMRFKEAEIYALHSIINNNENPAIFLNLCTLCTLRHDYKLARHYLNKAIIMDPSHPNINDVQKTLDNSENTNQKSIDFGADWTKEKELKSE